MKRVGIVGGGAGGMIAALYAAKNNAKVTLFEKKDRVGKKLLSTGNGRCNFSNSNLSYRSYYTDDELFVEEIIKKYNDNDLCMFLTGLGLLIRNKNGLYYPACEQASTVLDIFRTALKENDIDVITDCEIVSIRKSNNEFLLKSSTDITYSFDSVILACGGKAGLSKKENVNGYSLAKSVGHSVTPLFPALTQIKCLGPNFKAISGVRSECNMYAFVDENLMMNQQGEVLFTDYGLSGIVSFQLSHFVAECLSVNRHVTIVIDLLPGFDVENLEFFVQSKMLLHPELTMEEFFNGFLNKKLNIEIIKLAGLKPSEKVANCNKEQILNAVLIMKEFKVEATGVNDFGSAQVTAGGIPTAEVTDCLESKVCNDLYIIGEMLNVDGFCGGYNLQWAFSTGAIAGNFASLSSKGLSK